MKTSVCSRLAVLVAAFLLAGCSSLRPAQFAGDGPALEPEKYFTGRTRSFGVFENGAGEPTKRFRTDCVGHRDGRDLILAQTFHYDDGSTRHRTWRVRRLDAHRYVATAPDVIGKATGEAYGRAFRWAYTVELSPGNPLTRVRLRHWMYLQDDGRSLLNHATVTKFGVQLAQVGEHFTREEPVREGR